MVFILYFIGLIYLVPKFTRKVINKAQRTSVTYKKLLLYICAILVVPFTIMFIIFMIGLLLVYAISTSQSFDEYEVDTSTTIFNHVSKFVGYWWLGTIFSCFIALKDWYVNNKNKSE